MDKSDLPSQLHRWAIDEMHFRPQGRHVNSRTPSVDDFRAVTRGSIADVWKFVLQHVHSAQTVRKVKGNLKLNATQQAASYRVRYASDSSYSAERAELIEKRRHLAAQLSLTLTSSASVSRELDRLSAEILQTEASYNQAQSRYREQRLRAALLNSHSAKVQTDVAKYEEYMRQVHARARTLDVLNRKLSEEPVLYSKPAVKEQDRAFETDSGRQMRQSCEEIANFLHKLLQGEFSNDKEALQRNKEALWRHAGNVSTEMPARRLLASVAAAAIEAARQLRENTARIDIKSDAEKLRFKYESGGHLRDISTSSSAMLKTVHQLLEEAHAGNIERFVETEKSRNNSWRLKQRLKEINDLLDGHLCQRYRDNPGALEMTRKLLQCEMQTAADRAGLRYLQQAADSLKEIICTGQQQKQQLYSKYQKIQDFRKLADSKQNLIHVLVKQNVNARSRLESQQTEIQQYIGQCMSEHRVASQSAADHLQNTVSAEVDSFATLALPYLMFSMIDSTSKVAVADLSINRLHGNVPTPALQFLQKVMDNVEFPLYKAPECLLPQVMTLQREIADIESSLSGRKRHLVESGETTAAVKRIQALSESVSQHDSQQLDRVLPMLQQRLAHVTATLTDCLRVKDTVQAWWDQPAQLACPWLVVDDRSLQQWRDKWTVDVTRLRQANI